jgi:uncharacterized protein YjaG (DUF416 family)
MTKLLFCSLLFFIFLMSCSKEESGNTNLYSDLDECTEAMLQKNGMIEFTGQPEDFRSISFKK